MARPRKNTVDYFPHPVNSDDSVNVMEQLYGVVGYACYYKLRQLLGRTDNHLVDFSSRSTLLFFSASLKCSDQEVMNMMDTLCDLNVIDRNFWYHQRHIWCQEFVDSISDVYRKRGTVIPGNTPKITINPTIPPVSVSETTVSVVENTQSKVKESIVDERKVFIKKENSSNFNPELAEEKYKEFSAETTWCHYVAMELKIPGPDVDTRMKEVLRLLHEFLHDQNNAESLAGRDRKSLKGHFIRWARIELEKKQKNETKTNNGINNHLTAKNGRDFGAL